MHFGIASTNASSESLAQPTTISIQAFNYIIPGTFQTRRQLIRTLTMLHKRKRSTTILSSPTSDLSGTGSTVQSFYPHTKPILSPFHSSSKSSSFDSETPSYLNIRTRKRHRDNRPDAESVHGTSTCWLGAVIQMRALADVSRIAAITIQRLYQAQREHAAAEPGVAPGQQQQHQHEDQDQTQQLAPQPQKSTLHSFWRIEQPVPIVLQVQRVAVVQEPRCEDCDGALTDEGAMDVDQGSVEDKACGSCRRPVCNSCAVYGRERVCAGCAGCERGW
jgi:hypothetical protein